ncbi:hypothetical protein [Dulcicalothrix desertica]|uniref:hypothetical protein n=1 Tax=Dulcicalothrix desertica TaxID=32056 RepID=UPI001F3EDB8C|nr:hypothetical protein [Dulcicalothrix desertica]
MHSQQLLKYRASWRRGTHRVQSIGLERRLHVTLIIDEDVRRCMTRRFPYGILYTIEQHYILILAVMHCSREPGYWKSRR